MASRSKEHSYKRILLYGFAVHNNFLCVASPFFEATCKSDQTINLPEDDPEAIQTLVYWMYENQIYISEDISGRDHGAKNEEAMRSLWRLFVKLYLPGEKYQMPRICNHAIDALVQRRAEDVDEGLEINFGIISDVYSHTTTLSPLRSLLLTMARYKMTKEEFREMRDGLSPEFIYTVALSFFKDRGDPEYMHTYRGELDNPALCVSERFHEHGELHKGFKKLVEYKVFVPEKSLDILAEVVGKQEIPVNLCSV